MIADLQSSYSTSSPCSDTYSSCQSRASPLSLSEKNLSLGPPINCKWHIGCGLDGGGVWSLGHVGVSLVYTLRTLNVRADLPSSVKPGILAMRDTEIFILNISLGSYCG
ncbi:hypothetical protein OUZ56_032823 [Daphnia magna]|uniref:Uncharacterized protein n=1 Tax=Daphnia magna TaxID=35525 RepID=A0ABR0BA03_9CRUS|nr:hypothetical protein OUZ56_032823 [Daphnia magna]